MQPLYGLDSYSSPETYFRHCSSQLLSLEKIICTFFRLLISRSWRFLLFLSWWQLLNFKSLGRLFGKYVFIALSLPSFFLLFFIQGVCWILRRRNLDRYLKQDRQIFPHISPTHSLHGVFGKYIPMTVLLPFLLLFFTQRVSWILENCRIVFRKHLI